MQAVSFNRRTTSGRPAIWTKPDSDFMTLMQGSERSMSPRAPSWWINVLMDFLPVEFLTNCFMKGYVKQFCEISALDVSAAVAVPTKERTADGKFACKADARGRFPEDSRIGKEEARWRK